MVRWEQYENDAVAAFGLLGELAPALQSSILGFPMDSGVAAAITDRVTSKHLILYGVFTIPRCA